MGYASAGLVLADDLPSMGDAGMGDASFGEKAAVVGAYSAAGGAAGTAVMPVFGTAVGTAGGAIYGTIDQFGGDIKRLFGGKPRSEDYYADLRVRCQSSGGSPTPGVAPDNYGGCTYPTGAVSGGDRPFPGTWNGEIRDRTAYDAAMVKMAPPAAPAPAPAPAPMPLPRALRPRMAIPKGISRISRFNMMDRAERASVPSAPSAGGGHKGLLIAGVIAGGAAAWWFFGRGA